MWRIVTPEAEAQIRALDGTNGRTLVIFDAENGPRVVDVTGQEGWEPWWLILDTLALEAPPAPLHTLSTAARLAVTPLVKAETLTDEQVAEVSALFPDWAPGIAVQVGEVYRWDGTLVEVI